MQNTVFCWSGHVLHVLLAHAQNPDLEIGHDFHNITYHIAFAYSVGWPGLHGYNYKGVDTIFKVGGFVTTTREACGKC